MDKKEELIDRTLDKVVGNFVKTECEPLYEMARVGFMGGGLEVYVRSNDPGNIPHVHVRDTNSYGGQFETCVELKTNRYFLHGNYRQVMNGKMCRAFNEFMHSPKNTKNFTGTMYEYAVMLWNDNTSQTDVNVTYDKNDNPMIPDYETITLNK